MIATVFVSNSHSFLLWARHFLFEMSVGIPNFSPTPRHSFSLEIQTFITNICKAILWRIQKVGTRKLKLHFENMARKGTKFHCLPSIVRTHIQLAFRCLLAHHQWISIIFLYLKFSRSFFAHNSRTWRLFQPRTLQSHLSGWSTVASVEPNQ